jgi:hypothetical protein
MTSLVDFLASSAGRLARIVAGLALIVVGVAVGGATLYVLSAVGVVMIAAGVFDFCLFAPLAKLPLAGQAIRTRQR